MTQSPTELALRHLSEARALLLKVIQSSETFDYPKAKVTLAILEQKIRELGRVQASLQRSVQEEDQKADDGKILSFPGGG